ncbi:MAG: sodium:proton antiporter [Planctomycetaceae bacterium]|jgi:Na+/H+ antiporter NhaD/arsenite permease-like protein|nr:sodium:proton antiporter [Planctomycetaceae bacterium]MBT6493177.1 sodium:proton antiporter [Planctomycetaceae bacterium]
MQVDALTCDQHNVSRKIVIAAIAAVAVMYAAWHLVGSQLAAVHVSAPSAHAVEHGHGGSEAHPVAASPALYSIVPFAALLLCIALLPLFRKTEHWWECNWNRLLIAGVLGSVTLLYYAFVYGHGVVDHSSHALSAAGWPAAVTVLKNAILVEYIPFITLLFSLYVISGGIAVEGHLVGRPKLNTAIIGIGGLMASFIGTTGAAMLLIRPLIAANRNRKHVSHTVVFFIFVACNTGGCLLPIGDPPLFLGFLRGVPFDWTLSLWPMWLFMNISLMAIYFVWDSLRYRGEDQKTVEAKPESKQPFALRGGVNFLWLIGVIACVILFDPSKAVPGTHWHAPLYFRELMMLALTALSLWSTSPQIRQQNSFNYDAILEVAALFIGIFICMQAPVQLLTLHGASLGVDSPQKFYWGTGILSSFLDNAPTYVVFFETARSTGTDGPSVAGISVVVLSAISLGAVFMGAMTYIGNGPNFMVKAIAEKNNVRMPSFFGYMAYSCAVLLPLSFIMTWIFL